jgi:hypothetical protein
VNMLSWFSGAGQGSKLRWLPAALLSLAGCSQQTVTVQLHPLQQSGDVTYVCRVAPGAGPTGRGVPLSECNFGSMARGERDLFALVTQTSTGEIAVINVPYDLDSPASGEGVVDLDLNTPGYGFLPIGALPGDIVSTPGGFASFVGVGEVGKPGLFALPTTMLAAPRDGEPALDITSWPACSLPAAPGSIALVVEPPDADGTIYSSCDHATAVTPSEAANTLGGEGGPPGRRKLLVSLPDLGSIAVIDAESLLARQPGSFQPCPLEGTPYQLTSSLPAQVPAQVVPDDLKPADPSCSPSARPEAPSMPVRATPAGFALSDDGTLYVADSTFPLIHALDVKNPCALSEGEPLYPSSYGSTRSVTTSRLAVSPLTPSAKRFVYAIDQFDRPTASVMAFDVSPGSTNRTPLVRPRSVLIQTEAADRIQLAAAPKDISFLERDRPVVDEATGNVVVGEACDPNPGHTGSVGASYRPASDYSRGARAAELRGVFGSILLSNGQVTFVDVEDYDAACRRPLSVNPNDVEDFRGCRNDPADIPNSEYVSDGVVTVTNEVSCQMVEPHRLRSGSLGITSGDFGIRAPSLRSLPQFRPPDTALQATQAERPKLLGVDFDYPGNDRAPDPAQVFVGSSLYMRTKKDAQPAPDDLVIDPTKAERHSVVLPFNEPRAYPSTNDLSLTFEGPISGTLTTGFLMANSGLPGLTPADFVLRDVNSGYCDLGVNDVALMKGVADRLGVSAELRDAFAEAHADYVVITADFPEEKSSYWTLSQAAMERKVTRASCEALFGKFDDKVLRDTREFTIVDAQQSLLSLRPRTPLEGEARAARAQAAIDCFPEGTQYVIRASDQWILRGSASGFRHRVKPSSMMDGAYFECEFDCDPNKQFFESRVFEIFPPVLEGEDHPELRPYCRANAATGVELDETKPNYDVLASKCVHRTPTERFAVYRGAAKSERDMTFSWQTIGGFSTLRIDLGAVSAAVSPQNLVPLPGFNWLSVVDASSLGLAMLSLDTLTPLTPTLY